MSLYNMVNGVNPATFIFLPMLGKHYSEYPRFRDCGIDEEKKQIIVLTRVGGGNRDDGYGEELLYDSPYFVTTYDADWDSTYGYYCFRVPDEWMEDFDKIVAGKKPSPEYIERCCKIYPKIKDKIVAFFDGMV